MMEPLVWDPSATGTIPAATAAADPLDDPPGVCSRFLGFFVGPGWNVANSVVTVLPKITAPRSRRRRTMVASATAYRPSCKGLPQAVGKSMVSMMSFTAIGTPYNGPGVSPRPRCRFRCSACKRTTSSSRQAKTCNCSSTPFANVNCCSYSDFTPTEPLTSNSLY